MKLASGHLSYCTNIHAGESWMDHFEAIKKNFPIIKKEVSPGQPMGIGLRLSNSASTDLLDPDSIQIFKDWLNEHEAYVFTMNGFPYGDFHHAIVKDQVHAPDWTSQERLEYTIRLFKILAELLPQGMEGGISTSPLSYRHWFSTKELSEEAKNRATRNIILVAEQLYQFNLRSGIQMHLDIEPEPDGMLETGAEFIAWYENMLIPMAKSILTVRLNMSESEVEACIKLHSEREIRDRVRVKVDTIGLGWGVVSMLDRWCKERSLPADIIAVNVAEKPKDQAKFKNQRAEMWWNARQMIQPKDGKQDIRLNVDRFVLSQMAGPTYTSDASGRVVIESKIDMKKRGVASPDRAEAILLALYENRSVIQSIAPISIGQSNQWGSL